MLAGAVVTGAASVSRAASVAALTRSAAALPVKPLTGLREEQKEPEQKEPAGLGDGVKGAAFESAVTVTKSA
eukprot:5201016-Pleurochrysis_carterae.AAC.1